MFSSADQQGRASGIPLLMLGFGIVVSLGIGLLASAHLAPFGAIDNYFLDWAVIHSARANHTRATTVVDIDDESLRAVGQWPWPRYRLANLIEKLAADRPAALGLDVLLPEVDRVSLSNITKTFQQDFGLELSITGAPAGLYDNDGYLGSVLSQAGVVAPKVLYFDRSDAGPPGDDSGIRVTGATDSLQLAEASGELTNTPRIAAQTRYSGFLNMKPERDGTVRRIPLLIRRGGTIEAHLALVTFMRSLHLDTIAVRRGTDGPYLAVGTHAIPIDEMGRALLRFDGDADSYPAVSAVQLINGSAAASEFAGKIVFIGSSAAGLNDLRSTVFDPQFPGLKVLAATTDSIAADRFIREPVWAGSVTVAECLLIGVLVALVFVRVASPLPIVLGTLFILTLTIGFSVLLFVLRETFFSPGPAAAATLILFMSLSVGRLVIERRQAQAFAVSLANARHVTMEAMAAVAESRDPETGAHIKRTQHYVRAIARQLRTMGRDKALLTDRYIELLFHSAPLHDIGKVGVPDHILLKPGKLSDSELVIMRKHATFGKEILESAARSLTGDNFLRLAGEVAASHHEKWDGSGYPLGLAGIAIPLSGRIMAVADVYDALINRRCYKAAFPHEMARELIFKENGKSFDPLVLEAFSAIQSEIQAIAARFRDEPVTVADPIVDERASAVLGNGEPSTGRAVILNDA